MIKAVKLLSLLILLLLLSTYYPTYKIRNTILIFTIKNVEVENNKVLDSKKIINELENLKGKSLLFVDREIIKSAINKFDFISSIPICLVSNFDFSSSIQICLVSNFEFRLSFPTFLVNNFHFTLNIQTLRVKNCCFPFVF